MESDADEFDPNDATDVDADKDPSDMTPAERAIAAKHALYEVARLFVGVKASLGYMAELAGVDEDEVEAIMDRAEIDELRELEELAEGDEEEYEVADSYEDAETRGHDPEAAADRIFEGKE